MCEGQVGKWARQKGTNQRSKVNFGFFSDIMDGDSPLIQAVTGGCLATVETLLAAGADVNRHGGEDECGATPLHFAAGEGYGEIVSTLLQKGAEKDALDDNGQTPLFWACKGHLPVVETLVAAGADLVGTLDDDGYAPLHVAATEGHDEIVSFLLKKGADEDALDDNQETPLCKAAYGGHHPVVKTLLAANADISDSAALLLAAGEGHGRIVSLLLDEGADKDALNDQDETPLCKAALGGHLPVVETLLSADADVDRGRCGNGLLPLHLAACKGYGDIVSLLLKNGAEKDAFDNDGQTPLVLAVKAGHLAIVEALMVADADICGEDTYGFTALHGAVQFGHDRIASILAQGGVDKNALGNCDGITPLMLAVSGARLSMVETLVVAGADMNTRRTVDGTTALHCAVQRRHAKIASLLLRNGADPDVRDKDGDTPLIWAIDKGLLPVVEALLAAGADLAMRCDGCVALHVAADVGHDEIVSLLLQKGAGTDALNDQGETPLFNATTEGHLAVVNTLLAAGADVNARSSTAGGGTVLHLAVCEGHGEIMSLLLKAGADKDALDNKGGTPLFLAIERGHFTLVDALLAADADANPRIKTAGGGTVLHLAASDGCDEIVSLLLKKGANENAVDDIGETSLFKATIESHLAVMKTLVAAGGDLSIRSSRDYSVLDCASEKGDVDIVQVILGGGADVDGRGEDGSTALHKATEADQEGAIDALIDAGANIELKTGSNGSTPFWEATSFNLRKAMLALLRHGAAVNAPDADGHTPLHCVCKVRHQDTEEVVELLLTWGADEAALTKCGKSPADLLVAPREDYGDPPLSQDVIARVRVMLARAPANRAWRRRCWLCMLRARFFKARAAGCDGDETGSNFKLVRSEDIEAGKPGAQGRPRLLGGESRAEGQNEDLTSAVAFLLGLELEGLFRTVVSFL